VTSGSGDGKSTSSINLANAIAEGGYHTLLIDGDIRRGQLHGRVRPRHSLPVCSITSRAKPRWAMW
jgi:Mrp family chromosome partitioning ATPase